MTDAPFAFEGCDSPSVCREAIRPLLALDMDWSEVQCGRCGKRGIVRYADLDAPPSTSTEPAPAEADPAPVEVEDAPPPQDKGRNR